MHRTFLTSWVTVALLAWAVAGCDNPNPGAPLGTFSVSSSLTGNSCGSDGAASDPGRFAVTISNDDGLVYWFPDTGASSASGTINSARTVTISEVVADNLSAPDGAAGACTLQRNDTLRFTLAAGSAPAAFTGSYAFIMTPAVGAECSDQLASKGGGYAALPCTVSYSLAGTRK